MKPRPALTPTLVVVATMAATLGLGIFLMRGEPPPPAKPVPAPPPVAPPPPPSPAAADDAQAVVTSTSTVTSPEGVPPCQLARDGEGPVADACRRGGRDAAKRFMKAMVNRTKSRPERVTCDGCHDNLDDFTLLEGARTRLADLLAALGPVVEP